MLPFDAEEQAILESVESGQWRSVPDLDGEIARYQHHAQSQLTELTSVSIRLPNRDLQALQNLAQQTGTSLPLLISRVLHQYAIATSQSEEPESSR